MELLPEEGQQKRVFVLDSGPEESPHLGRDGERPAGLGFRMREASLRRERRPPPDALPPSVTHHDQECWSAYEVCQQDLGADGPQGPPRIARVPHVSVHAVGDEAVPLSPLAGNGVREVVRRRNLPHISRG